MIKPETYKQTNRFKENYGKFISKLFNLEVVGDTKKEAEEHLLKLIEWNSEQFFKVYQYNNIIAMLKRNPYAIECYQYFRLENGREQGVTSFDAKTDREAQEKALEWFNQYIECTA